MKSKREDHALIGGGVAKGTLEIQDVLNIPIYAKDTGRYLSKEQKEYILKASDTENTEWLSKDEIKGFIRALTQYGFL